VSRVEPGSREIRKNDSVWATARLLRYRQEALGPDSAWSRGGRHEDETRSEPIRA
jgi:hypothetical protein